MVGFPYFPYESLSLYLKSIVAMSPIKNEIMKFFITSYSMSVPISYWLGKLFPNLKIYATFINIAILAIFSLKQFLHRSLVYRRSFR